MTPLQNVYDSFLSKVEDYSFIKLNNDGKLESVLRDLLNHSIVRFSSCRKDLTIDEINAEFEDDLDLFEIEILSTIMTLSYISGKVLSVKNIEQELSDKEYRVYSKANHLSQLLNVKKDIQSEVSQLMTQYSFKNGLDDLD